MLDSLHSLYIDGEWIRADEREAVINPATEAIIGEAPVATLDHVEHAIRAAREAFDGGPWPRLSMRERQAAMHRLLDAAERRSAEILQLIMDESGALPFIAQDVQFGLPLKLTRQQVDIAAALPDLSLPPEIVPRGDGTTGVNACTVSREPVGVVVAITPYNIPFMSNLCKSVAALLVGCTVIIKPSPFTPFEALLLGQLAEEASLPKGVLNVVNGGIDVGEKLTTDPRIDMISFTGSDRVGALIQAQAAPTMKRVVLELGGKSALIVRPDADLDKAAAAGLGGITSHGGQGCVLLTRHLVHNSVRAAYVGKLKALLAGIRVGPATDPTAAMGPLIREGARARVESYVQIALDEGASLVSGGRRPGHLDKGFFFEPTLFEDVRNDFRIAQEEVFGPIGAVIGFDTDDEAIALANDSAYGLSGAVYSADVGKAYQMALALRTGGVTVNSGFTHLTPNAPFGGIKRSGHGREYGTTGLAEFTYLKAIDFQVA